MILMRASARNGVPKKPQGSAGDLANGCTVRNGTKGKLVRALPLVTASCRAPRGVQRCARTGRAKATRAKSRKTRIFRHFNGTFRSNHSASRDAAARAGRALTQGNQRAKARGERRRGGGEKCGRRRKKSEKRDYISQKQRARARARRRDCRPVCGPRRIVADMCGQNQRKSISSGRARFSEATQNERSRAQLHDLAAGHGQQGRAGRVQQQQRGRA